MAEWSVPTDQGQRSPDQELNASLGRRAERVDREPEGGGGRTIATDQELIDAFCEPGGGVLDRLAPWFLMARARPLATATGVLAALAGIALVATLLVANPPPPPDPEMPRAAPGAAPAMDDGPPSAVPVDEALEGPPHVPAGDDADREEPSTALVAHIAGAVLDPGVHVLGPDARVVDLLSAAGGPTPDADLDRVNLAAPVIDGSRLYIPRMGEEAIPGEVMPTAPAGGGATTGAPEASGVGPVAINTADVAALETLPGVGPATAQAIVAHRDLHGPFRQVEDLLEVRGIGEAKLAAIRDLVVL